MTVVVENRVVMKAQPAALWRLLTDFARHAAWHPFYRLIGEPAVGPIEFTYSSWMAPSRVMRAPARITKLEKDRLFEWRRGPGLFSRVTETYTISPVDTGTELVHRMEHSGLFASLVIARAKRSARRVVELTDEAIVAHLDRRLPSSNPGGRVPPGKRRWR